MTLLQAEAMNLTFRTMDVVYITGGVLTLAGIYWKLMNVSSTHKSEIDQLEKDFEAYQKSASEEALNAKNSRKSIRKESVELCDKNLMIANERINIVKEDLKELSKNTQTEFKEINQKLGVVSVDTAEIKGMLQNLLNK